MSRTRGLSRTHPVRMNDVSRFPKGAESFGCKADVTWNESRKLGGQQAIYTMIYLCKLYKLSSGMYAPWSVCTKVFHNDGRIDEGK